MMKSLGERDFSAQETAHHLLSLKLHSTTFNVKSFSLNGSRRLQPSSDTAMEVVQVILFLMSIQSVVSSVMSFLA